MQTRPKLSTRRGSTSASDPFGNHVHPSSDSLHSSSTLTIVRVVDPSLPVGSTSSSSPSSSSPRRLHRRLPSENTRISFAFSSFGQRPSTPPSPSSSPRLRPSSGLLSQSRLTPDQLLELARSSTNPNTHSPSHSPTTAPATFTPLPDDIYLPFIDRPAEVAALISSPPSAKLFALLAQTFPHSASDSTSDLPSDPTKWSYPQFHAYLTQTSRHVAPDALWVLQARKCVLAHSELIWERIKGALGVPPELDVDYDSTQPFIPELDLSSPLSTGSVNTDELSDDLGRSARGHWEDWDAIMDSPVFDRRHAFPPDPPLPSSYQSGSVSPSSLLSIEPLIAPPISSHPHSNQPPLTPSEMGLGDIQEGAEEEEEAADSPPTPEAPGVEQADDHDPDMISPSQIHGLRISTASLSSAIPNASLHTALAEEGDSDSALAASLESLTAPYTAPSPVSPLPPYPRSRPGSFGAFSRPPSGSYAPLFRRSDSFGSVGSVFKRSSSFGSVGSALKRSESFGSVGSTRLHDEEGSSSESGSAYIGNRRAGSPLFPSNFARLDGKPTLVDVSDRLRLGHRALGYDPKRRTYSHGANVVASSASVEYKRQSWGAAATGA